jgi:hypothetical protein
MAHYVHCAACRRAFDAAAGARCPSCPTPLSPPGLLERLAAASDAELEALRAAIDARLPRAAQLVMVPPTPARPAPLLARAVALAERLVSPLRRRLLAALR